MKRVRAAAGVMVFLIMTAAILLYLPWGRPRIEDARLSTIEDQSLQVVSDNQIESWNVSNAERERVSDTRSKITAITSNGGNTYLGTKDGEILILDGTSTETVFTANNTIDKLHMTDDLYALIGNESIVKIENSQITYNHTEDRIHGFSVSPDNRIAAWSKNHGIYLLDDQNKTYVSNRSGITDCSFSEDLAVAYRNKVEVYDTTTLDIIFERNLKEMNHYVVIIDRSLICSGGSQIFRIWDLENGESIAKRYDEDGWVRDLDITEDRFSITTEDRIYIFDSNGVLKKKIQSPPSTPLYLPLVAIGAILMGILTFWSEMDRQRHKDGNFYFKENKLPYDEAISLGSLGVFGMISFMLYLFIRMELLISMGLPMMIFFIATLWAMILSFIMFGLREVKLDPKSLYFSTSYYQERFKGWPRKAKLNRIRSIHPEYFFNKPQETMTKIGYQVSTIDGKVGKILFSHPGREKNIRKLKEAMKEAFGSKFDKVYFEEPYINEERWEEIKHLAKQSWSKVMMKFFIPLVPVFIIQPVFLLFPNILTVNILLMITFGVGAIAIFGVIYGMNHMKKYKEAQSIQAKREMKSDKKSSYSVIQEEEEFGEEVNPNKFLDYTKKDWLDVSKKLNLERPLIYLSFGILAVILILVAVGSSTENLILLIISVILPMPLLAIVSYMTKISKARNMVKNAVEHELKTGEKVLPQGFELPPPLMGHQISREPIEVTSRERELADKWSDEMQNIKMMVFISVGMFVPIGFAILYSEFFQGSYGTYMLFGIIMLPIILIMWFIISKQKIVAKVNEADRIEEMLEKRKKS
ncbi:MAG: WD40 repeat domain-containing protein [Thermoplasmatota archaeon]